MEKRRTAKKQGSRKRANGLKKGKKVEPAKPLSFSWGVGRGIS